MSRLTDNDRKFGPITYGPTGGWRPVRFVWSSGGGGDDDRAPRNDITVYAGGWCARVYLPNILQPWRQWVPTGHYAWAKSPDAGYWDVHSREYGFCLNDGFLTLFLGAQTHDSTTTQSKSWFLPWTQWDHVRHSIYQPDGSHFADIPGRGDWVNVLNDVLEKVGKAEFILDDYDGERIKATCYIEEREWHFGTGYFSWLKWFRKAMIKRSLSISFDKETGKEKGSWKGGTVGCSAEMQKGDTPEQSIRRYCDAEHRSKSGKYKMTFVGVAQ